MGRRWGRTANDRQLTTNDPKTPPNGPEPQPEELLRASRQSPPSAPAATLPQPGNRPGSACIQQNPHTDCLGTAADKCRNPAGRRYTVCVRPRSGSPCPPAHPASAENFHSTSAADNSPQSATSGR